MRIPTFALSLCALAIASCGSAQSGDSAVKTTPAADAPFKVEALGTFNEAWAISIEPGTGNLFITEKGGTMKFVQPANGRIGTVTGIPQVAYGGQGGLADFIFAPDYAKSHAIYLSWAEAGDGGNKGGAVGRGTLVCEEHDSCRIDGLKVIWRQQPKVPGVLQYALRMTFSPDGKYLFVASGDRVAIEYVQKTDNNLGKIVRLTPDG
jgi:glucose/arabinose dehydrogenase